jgi:hypothetical protein
MLSKLLHRFRELWHLTSLWHIQSARYIDELKASATNELNRFEHKTYSQYGEDGIIAEIFRRIGTDSKVFVEFGAGNGLENNTINLLLQNWTGFWLDGNAKYLQTYYNLYAESIHSGALVATSHMLTSENIVGIFEKLRIQKNIDFLCIDVDGPDYYLWQALRDYKPRVVCIEYNASFGSTQEFCQTEQNHSKLGGNFFGASLLSYQKLGTELGYTLVACNLAGNNAFFVRSDLVGNHFPAAGDIQKIYQPPRYYLSFYAGHRPAMGNRVR